MLLYGEDSRWVVRCERVEEESVSQLDGSFLDPASYDDTSPCDVEHILDDHSESRLPGRAVDPNQEAPDYATEPFDVTLEILDALLKISLLFGSSFGEKT